jgi:hypothetical protein
MLNERQLAFVRAQFAGKITMVDRWLGEVLDTLDRENLWASTMVIVTTDHGHYLGEHGWIGKPDAPYYNTLAQTPLMIWHPGNPHPGGRTKALSSAVDLYATILEALDAPPTPNVHSRSLMPLVRGAQAVHRDWSIYGYWGSSINISDGRYTYFQPCDRSMPAEAHSTMMVMMAPWDWFQPPVPHMDAEGGRFLPYTESPVWRYSIPSQSRHHGPMLYDVQEDPMQASDLAGNGDPSEQRMKDLLISALDSLQAPRSQYRRLRLN